MDNTYWQIQNNKSPLYPDIIWNQPENKYLAAKLLLIGGNSQTFNLMSEAYQKTLKTTSEFKIILPESLKKILENFITNCYFLPETSSGSLALKGLSTIEELSEWSDGIVLIGNFGQNSETTILLEKLITQLQQVITLTNDAVDNLILQPSILLKNTNHILVLNIKQLQKLLLQMKFSQAITSTMNLINFTNVLHNFTKLHDFHIITNFNETIIVAVNGQLSITTIKNFKNWQTIIALQSTIWLIQQPKKMFETLTTAVYSSIYD